MGREASRSDGNVGNVGYYWVYYWISELVSGRNTGYGTGNGDQQGIFRDEDGES